jgi:uncharacterized protein
MVEKIYFKNTHGQNICGVISILDTDTAILICHGLGEDKQDSPYFRLHDAFLRMGIATFRIDLLGHGESDGEYDDLTLTETIDDIICAKNVLAKKGYKHIGFIGSSFGGVGGIMAESQAHFEFLILVSPPTYYDIKEMIKSGIYMIRALIQVNKKIPEKKSASLNISFFKDYGSHDSYAAAEKIKAPVLIIHGDQDKLVPIAKSKELKKRIAHSTIKIFKGADHQCSSAEDTLVQEILIFVKNQTKHHMPTVHNKTKK